MKKKVHRAFVEEVQYDGFSAWHAGCHVTHQFGFGSVEGYNVTPEDHIDRAVDHLDNRCDAEHVI